MNANVIGTRMSSTPVLIAAGLITFVAIVWWATRGHEDAPRPTRAPPAAPAPGYAYEQHGSLTTPAAAAAPQSASDEDTDVAEAGFADYVNGKYRFLFRSKTIAAKDVAAIERALLERERIATLIRTAKQSSDEKERESIPQRQKELDVLERKIAGMLPASEIAAFEMLKDSDIEQFQLEDYAGGISNVAPVDEDSKQSILYTKLQHRQRFRRVLDDSRLMSGELTRAERKAAFADVSRALEASHEGYLREVRQYLFNDEQFDLLSNYENTEYKEELEKLRGIANGD
jgi:hypothetical protein